MGLPNMIKTFFKILLPILAVFINVNLQVCAQDFTAAYYAEQNAYISAYESITPAIVSIEADLPEGLSSGTGCIIDKSGVILTSLLGKMILFSGVSRKKKRKGLGLFFYMK